MTNHQRQVAFAGRSAAPVPPRQHHYDQAAQRALARLRERPPETLADLGARPLGPARWALRILRDDVTLDLDAGTVLDLAGRPIGASWRVLVLHYLAGPDPAAAAGAIPPGREPSVTFASLAGGRGYAAVYQARVIDRLARTVGRERQTLRLAAEQLGGRPVAAGDLAFDFDLLPRLRLRLVWYAGDEELPPSAVLLLPADVEAFLSIEDIVVLSENLVSALARGHV